MVEGRNMSRDVIASEAKQSSSQKQELDCFVARASRNDDHRKIELGR
jgi:hypothetical protein